MVTRILTSSCDKCQGALRQSYEDPKEWSCMNCGKLFLFLTPQEEEIQKDGRKTKTGSRGAKIPGSFLDTQPTKASRLAKEKEDTDLEGDDAEWNRLNGRS